MFRSALERAERAVPRSRIVAVVTAGERRFWQDDVTGLPPANVVVQPDDRGSAAAALLGLLHVHRQDPEAVVVVLPSDQFVEHELVLQVAIHRALAELPRLEARLLLLGLSSERPEPGYGWIIASHERHGGFRRVEELPRARSEEEAARLHSAGALINSQIFLATARELMRVFRYRLPQLSRPFDLLQSREVDADTLARIFDEIPDLDLGTDLFPRALDSLAVLPVPPCGWSDLATPERVSRCLEKRRARSSSTEPVGILGQLASVARSIDAAICPDGDGDDGRLGIHA